MKGINKMAKKIHCNTTNPSLMKLATITNNKVTHISKIGGKLTCKLNGERMTTGQARQQIISGKIIIDANGKMVN